MLGDLEKLVIDDMLENGFNPDCWEDVCDYWLDRLDFPTTHEEWDR